MVYCVIMHYFGMNVYQMFGVILKPFHPHNPTDLYDPNHPYFGNTNVKIGSDPTENGAIALEVISTTGVKGRLINKDWETGPRLLDWLFTLHSGQDIRMGFLALNDAKNGAIENVKGNACRVYQVSPISQRPVCYS